MNGIDINDIFASNFYIKTGEGLSGPFSMCDLLFIGVNANTPLGLGGYQNWTMACAVPGLLDKLKEMVHQIGLQPKRAPHTRQGKKSAGDFLQEKFYYKDHAGDVYGPLSICDLSFLNIGDYDQLSVNTYTDWQNAVHIPDLMAVIDELIASIDPKNQFDEKIFLSKVADYKKKHLDKANKSTSIKAYNDANKAFAILRQQYVSDFRDLQSEYGPDLVNDVKKKFDAEIKDIIDAIAEMQKSITDGAYEISNENSQIWDELPAPKEKTPSELLLVGTDIIQEDDLGKNLNQMVLEQIIDQKHIVAFYDASSKQECFDLASTLTCRMLMASQPKKFLVISMDPQDMEGFNPLFKSLPDSVYTLVSSESDIQKVLQHFVEYTQETIQKRLLFPITNIGEYNRNNEKTVPYQFIIIKAFPVGMTTSSISCLKRLMKSGQRAGLNVILLIDRDELEYSEYSRKLYDILELERLDTTTIQYDFARRAFPYSHTFKFSTLRMPQIQHIVQHQRNALNAKPVKKSVSYRDYLPAESEWWRESSTDFITMPFGVNIGDMTEIGLAITQENAQNAAIVVGRPGSGKSVFLHDIITLAAMKYSPAELEYYLIDFSGVEFEKYAQYRLPHAKVIAPEAEREFGLSVLREVLQEAYRREALLRENHVQNIVDLKESNPQLALPRIVLVIDEFQSLFSPENDKISREASEIIRTIIKKYRKLAINLILATQKISDISNSILPRDLIANRIVFNPTPADAELVGLGNNPPVLDKGECIYNDMAGVPSRNVFSKSFYMPMKEHNGILNQIRSHFEKSGISAKETIVFRSDELPELAFAPVTQEELPEEVGICFGQSFTITSTPVSATLTQNSNNNLLIIGGESTVAEKIAVYSAMSAMNAYTDDTAEFYFFNFMRQRDPLHDMPEQFYSATSFKTTFASKSAEVLECLQSIKAEMDSRKADEDRPQSHIFLNLYAFELGQMFKMGGRRGDDVSEAGQLLNAILIGGPLVGIFTILQVDTLANLMQLGRMVPAFTHRVVLQMTEGESRSLLNESDAANHLFVADRPYTRHLAYYFNPTKNIQEKFKPYK